MPSVNKTVGAKVVLEGEKEYKEAIANMNAANKVLSTEMQKLQAEYKGQTDSMEYLTKAGHLLEQQLLSQQEKVAAIRQRYEEAVKTYGEADTRTMRLAASLNQAETAELNLKNSIEENNKAMQGENETMTGLGDTVQQLADKLGIRLPQGATNALNGMQGLSAGTVAAMTAAAAAVAAVIKVVKELGEMTMEVAHEMDALLTQSMISGISTEVLQQWDYMAELIDVDVSTITGSLTKLTKSMASAQDGTGATAEAFEQLGVSVTNWDGSLRDSEDVFLDVIDALGGMANEAERDALAQQLLGRSAQELNPLIIQGSEAMEAYAKEAQEAGYILDKEQIQKLHDVDDSYQRLQKTIEGNRKQLAADFAPAAQAAMELFSDVVKKAGEMLERSGLIENLASIIESLISILRTAGEILEGIPGFNEALGMLKVTLGAIAQFVALIADAADLIKSILTLDFGGVKNALGFGYSSGNANNYQRTVMRQDGFLDEYDAFYGRNAGGTNDWKGGLTWVGEAGPEIVRLPAGSQIMNAQESRQLTGGDTFYFNINVDDLNDLQALILWARNLSVTMKMG